MENEKSSMLNVKSDLNEQKIIENSVVKVDNINYKVLTTEDDNFVITSVTNKEGTITATRNKTTNIVKMSSDFLTQKELKNSQKQADSIIEEFNEDENIIDQPIAIKAAAATSWYNGKWTNYKITSNGKFTAQTLIGVLGSAFGFAGAVVAGIANIAIQYAVKTGYYRVKIDVKVLDANYIMQRRTVELYSDSKRTKLVGSKKDTIKVWAGV